MELGLELFVRAGPEGPEIGFGAPADFFRRPEGIKDVISKARALLNGSREAIAGLTVTMASLTARSEVAHYEMPEVPSAPAGVETAQKGVRGLILDEGDGRSPTPVYDRSRLTNGHELAGPALIESEQTTLLVPPGWRMRVDRYNNAVIEESSRA